MVTNVTCSSCTNHPDYEMENSRRTCLSMVCRVCLRGYQNANWTITKVLNQSTASTTAQPLTCENCRIDRAKYKFGLQGGETWVCDTCHPIYVSIGAKDITPVAIPIRNINFNYRIRGDEPDELAKRKVVEPVCECGASKVGSSQHSGWCDMSKGLSGIGEDL